MNCIVFIQQEARWYGRRFNADISLAAWAKGSTVPQICKKIGVAEQTYYRWRKEYGSLSVDQTKRLKEIEKEDTRLRKLVADLSLDKARLKEVAKGKY